jgi:dUTP pyrophosphatase
MALRLDYTGRKPSVANNGDAGLDLCADHDQTLPANGVAMVSTGTRLAIPDGYFGLLVGRSGLGVKYGVRLANSVGIIDSGYRGEIIVGLENNGPEDYSVSEGERIAQIVIVPFAQASLHLVRSFDTTERGDGGFGSSGTE